MNKVKKNNTTFFKFIILLLVSIFIIFFNNFNINANNLNNSGIGYSVSKISTNQKADKKSSFYNLKLKPNNTKRISARVYNSKNKSIVVNTKILTTFTNDNGAIEYTSSLKKGQKYDKSLKYKASDYIKIDKNDQKIKIQPKSSRVVHATVTMPKKATGVMLGSWYFKNSNQKSKTKSKGVSINNVYSYALAIKMSSTVEPIQVPELHLLGVSVGLDNYKKAVYAQIQNYRPNLMKKLNVDTTIFNNTTGEKVLTSSKSGMSMAPNSNFKYATYAGDYQLKAGQYTMKFHASNKGRNWYWTKGFTITDKQAKDLNKNSINDPKPPISIWWYVLGVILLMIFVALITWLIVYLVMRKKRKE
ncbi:DUF3324 domain-containing protein [Lactobacillus sp. S2-2]|uniref:DUF916 and DUF3324 domain-containing protein n=1 Tax=Lactobacillus sp. S2-2 TaxID=2692917 RepID=UPI001F3DE851|nr:DUF916 and DUF3324 domain-containing protein [Lactobacillus sp. S2-2]MCF6515485.1 DUF3324 domain-containing protein [Lactobacillus sp. S2-2]